MVSDPCSCPPSKGDSLPNRCHGHHGNSLASSSASSSHWSRSRLQNPIRIERSQGQSKTPVSFVVPVSSLGYPVGSPGSSIWAYTQGSSGDWIPSSNLEDIPGTAANRMPNFPHQDTVKRGWLPNEQTPVSRFGEKHEPMSGMHHNMAMGDGGGVTAHGMAGTVWHPVATMQLQVTNPKVWEAWRQSVM
ncbi:uncharacterized protein LOC119732349 [Patiria miniata]|uniref:Uncharacterized protein n=1 Tax=Patiria miniata TaxID=46514 RepID=A0A914AEE8_PATMI|nr:uncharacterized protein LOC119732349 [Patiria miniata]